MAARALTVFFSLYWLLHANILLPSARAEDTPCTEEQHVAQTAMQLADRFGAGGDVSREGFGRLLADLALHLQQHRLQDLGLFCAQRASTSGQDAADDTDNVNCSQLAVQCPTVDAIFERHSDNESLKAGGLQGALQEAVFSITNDDCYLGEPEHGHYKPSIGQAWGYGIGFVTLVCIISNLGGLMTPIMSKNYFQFLLQFLVAMGAGTLCATGLLVLLPEAFDIVSDEDLSEDYVWKSTTAMFTIYVFFLLERLLKLLLKYKELKALRRNWSFKVTPPDSVKESDVIRETAILNGDGNSSDHGHSHFVSSSPGERKGPVDTVAWMVMIGDVIHNFVDGVAIGAAFTEDVFLGVSIGIAVVCEELPHELGDVAILLNSGLSMKKSLLVNFLAACVCYVGLIVGIVLGENTDATRWVLAMAGGLFLYVPLVDMLPDMSKHLDHKLRESQEESLRHGGRGIKGDVWLLLLLQALGLLVGMCIILIVSVFAGDIRVA